MQYPISVDLAYYYQKEIPLYYKYTVDPALCEDACKWVRAITLQKVDRYALSVNDMGNLELSGNETLYTNSEGYRLVRDDLEN